jgi:hypothetical protein
MICFNGFRHSNCHIADIRSICGKTCAVKSCDVVAWGCSPECTPFLFVTSWGGEDEWLGLLACAMENRCNFDACKLGAALHFEFYAEGDAFDSCDDRKVCRPQVIHIPQLHMQTEGDRQLLHSCLTAISTGGHHGILPSLMQKTICSITDSTTGYSIIPFVEALVSSLTGYAVLREGGLIPTLVPLLKDMDPEHTCLVSAAMHILEAFMDYSNPTGTLFQDLSGLNDTLLLD